MTNPVVIIGERFVPPAAYAELAARLAKPPYERWCFVAPFPAWRWALMRGGDYAALVDAVARTVAVARAESGAESVTLLAHGAGGWAARIYLGNRPYHGTVYNGHEYADQLITLGTPHRSIAQPTARLTQWLNTAYPGAYWPHLRYTSVVGRSIIGDPYGTLPQRRVQRLYRAQTGDGTEWGDGVVPLACAHLPGSALCVLPGVTHLPGPPTFYGGTDAVARWGHYLCEDALDRDDAEGTRASSTVQAINAITSSPVS